MIRRPLAAAAVVALAFSFTACGDDDDDGGATTEAPAGTEAPAAETEDTEAGAAAEDATIVIVDLSFGDPITVPVGTTVTIVNNDSVPHTVTADDGSFDTGNIDIGAQTTLTFDTAGTFPFHCNIHSSMQGSITVEG